MADKISALWKRMAEMFGAKALESKFGPTPPDTWRIAIDRLKDFELERGMRRMVYGGKPHIPSLPEFLRMCREVGGEYDGDAKPVPPARQLEHQALPRWEVQANLHLLAHLMRKVLKRSPVASDPAAVEQFVQAKRYWAQDMREHEDAGNLPADGGKALWCEYIEAAENAVESRRAA